MKTVHNYTIRKESWESQSKAGRYNPATEIEFRDKAGKHAVILSAGSSDDIHILRDNDGTYAVSINRRFGYVGLQVLTGELSGRDMFLDGDNAVEVLGKDFEDRSPIWLAKAMLQYIY